MKLSVKNVSSLEKCFLDEDIEKKREISSLSALCGEKLSHIVETSVDGPELLRIEGFDFLFTVNDEL